MNQQTEGLRVAGTVFAAIATAQAARLIIRPRITVNELQFPEWPSTIAVVFLSGLSAWMWNLSARKEH